jgi:hypothetical protein
MNQMIVRVTDQESLFREASTIAVEGKFKMSWFGLINEETKNVEPVMVAGENEAIPSKPLPQMIVHRKEEVLVLQL